MLTMILTLFLLQIRSEPANSPVIPESSIQRAYCVDGYRTFVCGWQWMTPGPARSARVRGLPSNDRPQAPALLGQATFTTFEALSPGIVETDSIRLDAPSGTASLTGPIEVIANLVDMPEFMGERSISIPFGATVLLSGEAAGMSAVIYRHGDGPAVMLSCTANILGEHFLATAFVILNPPTKGFSHFGFAFDEDLIGETVAASCQFSEAPGAYVDNVGVIE